MWRIKYINILLCLRILFLQVNDFKETVHVSYIYIYIYLCLFDMSIRLCSIFNSSISLCSIFNVSIPLCSFSKYNYTIIVDFPLCFRHGTNCAGIVAAVANDHCTIGIAFNATISGMLNVVTVGLVLCNTRLKPTFIFVITGLLKKTCMRVFYTGYWLTVRYVTCV